MAVITSATTGNFSAGATWVGGVVPGPADDAVAATGTVVTIDTDVTVISFQQAGTGKFVLGGGRTVSGNVIANAGTFASGGTVDVTATTTAVINGNVTGVSTTANNTAGIVVSGTGALTLNGTVTGSAGNGASVALGSAAVYTNVTCTITINGAVIGGANHKRGFQSGTSSNGTFTILGNVTGGNAASAYGCMIDGITPTLNVTGIVACGLTASAQGILTNGSTPTLNITGDVVALNTALSSGHGIVISVNGVVSVVGDIFAGAGTSSYGIWLLGVSPTLNLTGSVYGGSGSNSWGINASGASSTVSVIGSATAASTLSHGISSSATANGVIFQGNLTDSLNGATAIYSRLLRITATNSGTTTYTNTVGYPTGTPVTRVSPDLTTGMPATTNVRNATVYGYNSELTGTMNVPSASNVRLGVAVDNTTGTGALDVGTIIAVTGAQVAAASSNPSVV